MGAQNDDTCRLPRILDCSKFITTIQKKTNLPFAGLTIESSVVSFCYSTLITCVYSIQIEFLGSNLDIDLKNKNPAQRLLVASLGNQGL